MRRYFHYFRRDIDVALLRMLVAYALVIARHAFAAYAVFHAFEVLIRLSPPDCLLMRVYANMPIATSYARYFYANRFDNTS